MYLHIFNPEHDIALAANLANFTAPHAGRQLRHDLGFLPALWADEDDVVLVDDVEQAQQSYSRLVDAVRSHLSSCFLHENHRFLPLTPSVSHAETDAILPWGWDRALCERLRRCGVAEPLLPTDERLDAIRLLSHRRTSARLLPLLQGEQTVGEAFECHSLEEVATLARSYQQVVIKAPWSSSGRGVKFCDASRLAVSANWVNSVIARQGSVMVEPLYNKVKDFGVEFSVDTQGVIHYEGLSLFQTVRGAYVGNILASEQCKRDMLSRYLPLTLLDQTVHKITQTTLLEGYTGPFGIDMMVCDASGGYQPDQTGDAPKNYLLHPCVELNLRRTMGHVALSLSPSSYDETGLMCIELTDHYRVEIKPLQDNIF